MPPLAPQHIPLLRLSLVPGLGPVLIRRAIELLGSAEAVLAASPAALQRVKGIGDGRARTIAAGIADSQRAVDAELALAESLNVRIAVLGDDDYPPLLTQINDAPPLLYIRGTFEPNGIDRYPIAIVGSRSTSQYGIEQAERFALALSAAGLTIISGGARGIDTAAHRASIRAATNQTGAGRTVAVLGCGLAECYPPDNRELFDRIAAGNGAIVSELPLNTPPNAENFPARNRIISGLSLGVLVIEAGLRSGALITARLAAEDHGREVFALPARVDSPSAQGSLELLKSGGAQMVTHPTDIIQSLESPARHLHAGTHEVRFSPPTRTTDSRDEAAEGSTDGHLFAQTPSAQVTNATPSVMDELASRLLAALDAPRSIDELANIVSVDVAKLRAELTMLEIKRRVVRRGSRFERAGAPGT